MAKILDGTVALVTGASSGIGAATALTLARHGASVAIAARRADRLTELSNTIQAAGGGAIALEADVTNEQQAREIVERTVQRFGRLDTPKNNAGGGVYNATKFAVGAFSEALRQEVTKRQVRVALVEPGFTATELQSHNSAQIQDMIRTNFALDDPLQAEDIADAIAYIVTRPRHVAINEILVRPTQQDR